MAFIPLIVMYLIIIIAIDMRKAYERQNKKTLKYKLLKIVNVIVHVILIIFIVWFFWVLWEACLKELFPYTKTSFESYKDFREITDNYYPDEQPASASDIKYYFYEGHFDDRSAVSFIVDEKDLKHLEDHYTAYFDKFDTKIMNRTIQKTFTSSEGIEYLDTFLNERIQDYRIVAYITSGSGSDVKDSMGVICNDKTGEFIIFSSRDAFPKK